MAEDKEQRHDLAAVEPKLERVAATVLGHEFSSIHIALANAAVAI
jgi:hypothetical protein